MGIHQPHVLELVNGPVGGLLVVRREGQARTGEIEERSRVLHHVRPADALLADTRDGGKVQCLRLFLGGESGEGQKERKGEIPVHCEGIINGGKLNDGITG